MPDPMPASDGHYKPFSDVARKETSEQHRLSLHKLSQKEKRLPFYPSVQHVKNASMMLLCEECSMWRLVYARRKLTSSEKQATERVLDGLSFSCGSELQDADIPPDLKDVVYVKKLQCTEPVEKLYYSANLKTSASIARKKCQNLKSHRNIILSVLTVPSPESQERTIVDLFFFFFFFCIFIYLWNAILKTQTSCLCNGN